MLILSDREVVLEGSFNFDFCHINEWYIKTCVLYGFSNGCVVNKQKKKSYKTIYKEKVPHQSTCFLTFAFR